MDNYIAEIRMFCGNFAPRGWAFCNGQIMSIAQNTALFSLLGTTYGGDGKTTFALPNLQGRTPLHVGQANYGTYYELGEMAGSETVTALSMNLPAHGHSTVTQIKANNNAGNQLTPVNGYPANTGGRDPEYNTTNDSNMGTAPVVSSVGSAGSSQPMNNMQPYLAVNFIIALQGNFPPRG